MRKDKKEKSLSAEEVKDATTNAIIAMGEAKYLLAAITDEANNKVVIHQQCSFNQIATIVKGVLSMNEVLAMDVFKWCSEKLAVKTNKGIIIN